MSSFPVNILSSILLLFLFQQSDMSEGTETKHVLDRRQLEEAKELVS